MTRNRNENKLVSRTSAGLRDAIFDELDAIRSGESNPTRANAIPYWAEELAAEHKGVMGR